MSNSEAPNIPFQEVSPARSRPRTEQISRKKACKQCSIRKVRCDHKRPHCTRCESRRINCEYAVLPRRSAPSFGTGGLHVPGTYAIAESTVVDRSIRFSSQTTPGSNDSGFVTSPATFPATGNSPHIQSHRANQQRIDEDAVANEYWPSRELSFANIDLVCTVDVTRIGNWWLGDFLPSFDQRVKSIPPSLIHFTSRVFGTYPLILLRKGYLPPFIHPSQLGGSEMPTPLANCLSLLRLWDGQVRGSESMVRETIKNEMRRNFEERQLYTEMNQLAAFQAYLLYAIVLFFADKQSRQFIDRQVMINLQDFACNIASSGVVCPGEISHQQPDWQARQ